MDFRIYSFKTAAFWSTAIHALGQALALVFSMVMAAIFGAQESTDVFYYCTGIFALVSGLFQAVNVNVLIPETMRRRHQAGEEDAMAFLNRFITGFIVILGFLTLWMMSNPVGVLTTISRFSPEALKRNTHLVFWLVATLPLQVMAQLLLDILVSYKFLALPASLSCVSRVINILFVGVWHRQLGVMSVALGLMGGLLFQMTLNLYLLRRVIHWRPRVWRTQIGRSVFQNILWTGTGTLACTLAGYLPLFLFSGFEAGILTALNYARRLSEAPVGLLTSQISGVMAVKFNELAAKNQEIGLAEALEKMCRLLVFGLVPMSVWLFLVGPDLVSILFSRGAFRDAQTLAQTSILFSWFVLSMPLTGVMMIIARYFVAHQAIGYGTKWQIGSNILYAILVYLLVRAIGPVGFPIGIVVHLVLYLLLLSGSMARRFPLMTMKPVWRSLFATSAWSAALALPIWIVRMHFWARFSPWMAGGLVGGSFAFGYILLIIMIPPDTMAKEYAFHQCRVAGMKIQRFLRGGKPDA